PTTAPVGSYEAGRSPYGIHDMAGNVAEWVADWYSDSYYARSPSTDPPGPEAGQRRIVRGGGWSDSLMVSRSTRRLGVPPSMRAAFIGFRIARPATD
ncbi:SUMF1/EgtB/PvdO family nonheme iron enzyme, partial [Candidatus Poribacteria bacterium]|nr:SUMF1/EgtB/PvdO family nonheme iron enzyme [Candidatus Poribacteria bacterium]